MVGVNEQLASVGGATLMIGALEGPAPRFPLEKSKKLALGVTRVPGMGELRDERGRSDFLAFEVAAAINDSCHRTILADFPGAISIRPVGVAAPFSSSGSVSSLLLSLASTTPRTRSASTIACEVLDKDMSVSVFLSPGVLLRDAGARAFLRLSRATSLSTASASPGGDVRTCSDRRASLTSSAGESLLLVDLDLEELTPKDPEAWTGFASTASGAGVAANGQPERGWPALGRPQFLQRGGLRADVGGLLSFLTAVGF